MRLTASDMYSLYRPSRCDLRVYLRHRDLAEAPAGPYDQVIRRLGERHERSHLETFPAVVDLSFGTRLERETRTREEVHQGAPVIYQPALRAEAVLDGIQCEIVGDPDFLIREGETYVIRDSKISRRITEKDHPEILLQLGLYGWLYRQTFGTAPLRLEVHSGTGEIVEVEDDGGEAALKSLTEILRVKRIEGEPYSPVGWTKCGGCPFHSRCWPRAEETRDVALVAGVDQGLARALREVGVHTIEQLVAGFDEERLAEFKRPFGGRTRRVGTAAKHIVKRAEAMVSGKEVLLEPPELPEYDNYVMFDLEGLPPQLDELEKIYLWGLQVFGQRPGEFQAATAGFGADGDRQGWVSFLEKAKAIFKEYGDLPFVHWHHYERVRLDMYVERFGDRDGVAQRVRNNLLDLLPITQRSLALPLPSYSLKVVEKYIGFERSQEEYGGDWAMAKYIEATEMEDENERQEVLEGVLKYNQEDLEATWAVLCWLRSKR